MKRWTLGVGLAWMVAASAAWAQEESCWTQAQWDAAYVQAAATMGLPYVGPATIQKLFDFAMSAP